MRPLLGLLLLASLALAQRVTLGAYGEAGYWTPSLELAYPLSELTLRAQAQRGALGLGVERTLELGPAGRVAYGALAAGGAGGLGARAFLQGGLGPAALEVRLAYATLPWKRLFVGWTDPDGLSGSLEGRYRLSPEATLGLALGYGDLGLGLLPWGPPAWGAEGRYGVRAGPWSYTLGLGFRQGPYALVGWRAELDEEGTVGEAVLRLGAANRLEARLYAPLGEDTLGLRLALGYPFRAAWGVAWGGLSLEGAYDGSYALWLRYAWETGR